MRTVSKRNIQIGRLTRSIKRTRKRSIQRTRKRSIRRTRKRMKKSKSYIIYKNYDGTSYTCDIEGCNVEPFTNRNKFYEHKNLVHSTKIFRCPIDTCDYKSLFRHNINRHLENNHKKSTETYYCDYTGCSFKSPYKYNLKTHKSVHSGDKNFKCSNCEKKYTQQSGLHKHYINFPEHKSKIIPLVSSTAPKSGEPEVLYDFPDRLEDIKDLDLSPLL